MADLSPKRADYVFDGETLNEKWEKEVYLSIDLLYIMDLDDGVQ